MIKPLQDNFLYRQGYFKALLDVKNYFDKHSESLKHNKMYNSKKIPLLLQAFFDNADEMIMWGDNIDLRVSKDGKRVFLVQDVQDVTD